MAICKYCSIDFDEKEWHEGEEKTTCFTCCCLRSAINYCSEQIGEGKYKNKKSIAYWRRQLGKITV